MSRLFKCLLIAAVVLLSSASYGDDPVDVRKIKAKKIAVELTELRSRRAAAFVKPHIDISLDLFKEVCGAVRKRTLELAKEEGVIIRHAAIRYRHPDHAATEEEASFQHLFESRPEIREIWDETEREGKRYKRYILPVYVEEACLACHGEKDRRPDFIKTGYPADSAFGFRPGNIRGIVAVLIPLQD